METRELFVNGVSVDFFSDDEPIPLILQINDLGDLQSLQGSVSKMFKLPLTQKNRTILGYPDDVPFTTNTPYMQLPAKYLCDGIELVANGLLEIQGVQDDYVDVMLLFGNIDFLDQLGGQVYDMGDSTSVWSRFGANLVWKPYDHPWSVASAAGSQKKTDGWIWPIVNYGDLDTIPPFTGVVNVRNLRPGFFLHTAIELLVKTTGYSIDKQRSCIYNDPVFANLYKKLIIQFSNSDFEHGTDFQNTPDNLGAKYTNGLDQVISNPRIPDVHSSNIYNADYPFSGVINFGPSDHYAATTSVNLTATLQFDLYMRGRMTGHVSIVIIKFTLVDRNGVITDFASQSFVLDQNYRRLRGDGANVIGDETFLKNKISQDFSLVEGDKVYVRYHINNPGTGPEDTYVIFKKQATFSINTNEKFLLLGQTIQCERILPDVSQLDLLKDMLQKFGLILIADPNTNTIIFTSFKTIVGNIQQARDWSDKCKDMGRQVSFQLGKYCQVNWLRYQQDSAVPLNYMPKYFADDSISISDKTLNPTQPVQDLFTSIFAPSLNCPYLGGTTAQISDPTSTETFSVGSEPRLLIDQKLNISTMGANGNPLNIIFQDTDSPFEPSEQAIVNDIISVPYFYKPDAPDLGGGAPNHLSYKDQNGLPGLKSTFYPELQNILKQTKKVTRYFYLTPADILDFDFTIPVYLRQDGCYYYVSKIDSWVKGYPVKVDLVKL